MMIFEEGDHMMKDRGLGFRTVDIQIDAVPEIGEHNFPWLELAREIRMVAPIRVVKIGI
jgi:hypothetical protein